MGRIEIEALEAELRESFDRTLLAVYADALQAQGDVRGELVAIDLALDAGPDDALLARRRALLAPLIPDPTTIQCHHGFVEILAGASTEAIDTVLLGPLGPYLRTLTIADTAKQIRCIVMTLVLHRRPWLEHLAIHQTDRGSVRLSNRLALQLALALPRLRSLAVVGRDVFPLVTLPTVQQLAVSPIDSLAALTASPLEGYLPAVRELDAVVGSPLMLARGQLPALRRLDLSRSGFDAFRFIAQLQLANQLEHLRLPQLGTIDQALALQRALDRMPELTRLELVGARLPNLQLYTPAEIQWGHASRA